MSLGMVVIVGGGHGGFQVAASLRQFGFNGRLCLINNEEYLPYQRPPLSKAFINGSGEPRGLYFRPDSFYVAQSIDVISDHAASIDRATSRVRLASGLELSYDHLVLATGARNRPLELANSDLNGVKYLRSLSESRALRTLIGSKKRLVVIGAGFIELEFAATARSNGLTVEIVEVGSRVMARAVTPDISEYFQNQHQRSGIEIHLDARVIAIEADNGKVSGVVLGDGRRLPANLILIGVGAVPNLELAAEAGLPVASGIVVNEYLLTEDPNISAIGDCALFASPRFKGLLRLESVQNATDQARYVANRLMGEKRPYDSPPWFWSDQGADKLQIVGLTSICDEVVLRGSPDLRSFSAFCCRSGRLVGIESVNRAGDHMLGRRLLGLDRTISPEKVADENFDLKTALV